MPESWPASLPCPFGGPFRGTVLEVHDGDTLKVELNLSFNVRFVADVRLYGIQAPELTGGTAAQRKAARAARDFVRSILPVGSPVRVITLVATSGEQTRSFVRYVASVEMAGAFAVDLAGVMVAAGHATFCDRDLRPLSGPPPAIERWIEKN